MAVKKPRKVTTPSIYDQASQIAQSKVQPTLNLIGQEESKAQSATTGRQGDISKYGQWNQDQLNKAFGNTSQSLNNLIATSAQGSQASRDSLAAALGRTSQQPLTGEAAQLLAGAERWGQSGAQMLGGSAVANLGAVGQQQGLAGILSNQQREAERQRNNAVMQDLMGKREAATASIGGLRQEALTGLREQGLKTRAQQFQEWLSKKELGVKGKELDFNQWLSRQELGLKTQQQADQKSIDWARIGIDRKQVEAQIAQYKAAAKKEKDKTKKDALDKKGKAVANAWTMLGGYLSGIDTGNAEQQKRFDKAAEGLDPSTPAYAQLQQQYPQLTPKYDAAFQQLVGPAGLDRKTALQIMAQSPYITWRKRAAAALKLFGVHDPQAPAGPIGATYGR